MARGRHVTSQEVVDAHIARLERAQPRALQGMADAAGLVSRTRDV